MANEYINKVVLGSETLIDLIGDTVTADKLAYGETAHGADGAPIIGTNTFDSDTSDDTATADEILNTKTAHARGTAITGRMPNNGGIEGYISDKDDVLTIPQGYHDGSGTAQLAAAQKDLLTPGNIKRGVTLLGVVGDYGGEAVSVETNKNASASLTGPVEVTPSSGYDYLAKVTIAQIPVTRTINSAGGYTVSIG